MEVRAKVTNSVIQHVKNGQFGRRRSVESEDNRGDKLILCGKCEVSLGPCPAASVDLEGKGRAGRLCVRGG